MRSVILCEGHTDAILLSYYLGRVYGWKPLKRQPTNCFITVDSQNQDVNWYKKADDELLICAVDGNTNFGSFYHNKIEHPIIDSDLFQKLVVITDHDKNTIKTIEKSVNDAIWGETAYFKNGIWTEATYYNSFAEKYEGALETVMLDAIAEDPYDNEIVNRCKAFIDEIRPFAEKYINKDRLALKAKLSATWAVQSPEKVFRFIDQQIRMVAWENSTVLKSCFAELSEL